MFATKCPGQDMRYWTADDVHEIKCPQCGELIEFFKTDIRLRCPNCKTRVANPRFDMGCAEWCAYAEQCLGPAARGLKGKSLRTVFEDELEKIISDLPDELQKTKDAIERAEKRCKEELVDMLPVIASIVLLTLIRLERVKDSKEFIDQVGKENTLPQQAVKEVFELTENILQGKSSGIQEKIIVEALAEEVLH
ncbi:MAG: hypothetical protein SCJ97_08805 [Bacillota bacterium]|nr:hypothetical protein [Bacillota bacterium]